MPETRYRAYGPNGTPVTGYRTTEGEAWEFAAWHCWPTPPPDPAANRAELERLGYSVRGFVMGGTGDD